MSDRWVRFDTYERDVLTTTKRGFYAYKKVRVFVKDHGEMPGIATLWIPKGTRVKCYAGLLYRTPRGYGKCRAEQAKVVAIHVFKSWGTHGVKPQFGQSVATARSQWDDEFRYYKGKIARPRGYFEETFSTCGNGIHFYRTKREAFNH